MNALTLVLGLFYVLSAEAQFGVSPGDTTDLSCSLKQPSGQTSNGVTLYPCVSSQSYYHLAIVGTAMNLKAAAAKKSNLQVRFHCTVKKPDGTFAYGGETIGFNRREKYFYAIGEGSYGRCYISADAALMENLKFKTNQSGVFFLPVKTKPKAQTPAVAL